MSWNQYIWTFVDLSQSLDVFKSFKAEVELQLGKKIKAVKSDRGGEYYGRYDGSREQRLGPFALFLKECGIQGYQYRESTQTRESSTSRLVNSTRRLVRVYFEKKMDK